MSSMDGLAILVVMEEMHKMPNCMSFDIRLFG